MEIHGKGPVRSGAPSPQQLEHTVQQGETLEGIANQHNISAESLLSNNSQIKNGQVEPGQVLSIPEHRKQTVMAEKGIARTSKMYLNLPPRVPETQQSGVILINHSSLQGKQEPLKEKPTKKC